MTASTAPTIDGHTMPEHMWDKGEYELLPANTVRNAQGTVTKAGFRRIEYRWVDGLEPPEWRWWTVTVLAGDYAKQCDVTVWNESGVEDAHLETFSDVVVRRPESDGVTKGHFQNVVVHIELVEQ